MLCKIFLAADIFIPAGGQNNRVQITLCYPKLSLLFGIIFLIEVATY